MPNKLVVIVIFLYFVIFLATLSSNFTHAITDQRLRFGDDGTVSLVVGAILMWAVMIFLFLKGIKLAKIMGYIFLGVDIIPGSYYLWSIGFRANAGTFLTLVAVACLVAVIFIQRSIDVKDSVSK